MPAFLAEYFRFERRMEDAVPIDFEDVEEIRRVDRREGEDGMVVVGECVENGRHAGAFQLGEGRSDGKMDRAFADAMLNDVLNDAQAAQQPPYVRGRQLRIYYATQSGTEPPTFVLFVNDEELMHFTYERYLENQLRKTFGFEGTPIRFILRNRKGDEER